MGQAVLSAAGQATGFKYGNGIYASYGFSPDRLQLNCLDYSTTNRSSCTHDSTSKFGLTYSYAAAPSNNGQISSITDYMLESGGGSTFPGRTGTYTTTDGRNFGIYPPPGFLNSGLSFASRFQGARVAGTSTGSQFAPALTRPPLAFNSETGYSSKLTTQIWTAQLAVDCWTPR